LFHYPNRIRNDESGSYARGQVIGGCKLKIVGKHNDFTR
jgi:hypothetical protein